MIASPLNYTGNKSRLLPQILPMFPAGIRTFVDLCCGGASVGMNAVAQRSVCIDSSPHVINLLQTLQETEEQEIVAALDEIISRFSLSDSFHNGYDYYRKYVQGNNGLKEFNKIPYYNLRKYYNTNPFGSIKDKSLCLFALIAYCFNNDIRFNSAGHFNMPAGKTDFNASMRKKLTSFKEGLERREIRFMQADFTAVSSLDLNAGDFVYADPPYLITDAVYNENGGWGEEQEQELLEILLGLHSRGIRFALSNVLQKKGSENYLLKKWVFDNKFNVSFLNYHYRSSSYNKKQRDAAEQEALICNYVI